MRSLIIDDETSSCRILRKLLHAYCPGVEVIAEAHSAAAGLQAIREHRPEVVFLDIQMPEGDGFYLLQQLPAIDFRVIFVTAYDQYAIRAIRLSALDYLLKPVNIDDLVGAVDRYRQHRDGAAEKARMEHLLRHTAQPEQKLNRIAIPGLNDVHFIEIDSIVRIEAEGNYSHFYTDKAEHYLVTRTLKEYDELLSGHHFFRVHQSHLVNLKKVTRYIKGKGGSVVLSDGSMVDVAVRKKEEFLNVFGA
jgi:two-component system, LytTR family, response regulator